MINMHNKPHRGHALRRGRFSEINQIYLVTTVTYNRLPLFHDLWLGRYVVSAMREFDRNGFTETLAYVLMPDHLHWVFQLQSGNLSRIVQQVKAKSGFEISADRKIDGQVWQRGFHDHALRREEDLKAVARYVVANPIRAGVVKSLRDYTFWDAIWL